MLLENSQWIKDVNYVGEISTSEKVNPSLIFDKYFLWGVTGDGFPTSTPNRKNYKMTHLEKITKYKIPLGTAQYNLLKNRKNSLPRTTSFSLYTNTRVIVNHGGESILENSISIHPYYGFPTIPGSAIKGVTRHYSEEFETLDKDLENKIFGNSPTEKNSQQGSIFFLDAWPKNIDQKNFFELDVFTPHYQEYYQIKKLPRDDQNPVPVYFLAVKKGVEFEFAIAPSLGCSKENLQEDLKLVKGLITNALKTFGIGAKTGSSYGYFK
ncbi:type III-B CRISPR module RAMP protein Cmr6 [Methanosarcina sp. DH1]|uniref:type III-B CRISPR module RAMP protein Cmr6 n=1 Tax=Methanosarcina sp. DH1 TaxID=2605695 RepID=UPI001E357B1A|nr:type III-B CRISPR module RAMP protein Cmr6 [Methanosarcina sp. DH1]MCC4766893.1 type III-B CRISPR module RAMP protein Cmr6 [Methanosarcina sp. DH1]